MTLSLSPLRPLNRVKIKGYQTLMLGLKTLAKVLPLPKPTLYSGPGASLQMCQVVAQMQLGTLLIVTDKQLVSIGLIDPLLKLFEDQGVTCVVYEGVEPDPTYEHVEQGWALLKAHECKAVLAVGGGSSIDTAKVIAALATNAKPIRKLAGYMNVFNAPLPLFVIPTTAGTGSEVTVAAVVSDPKTHQKTPILDPKLVPMMAALDGALMTGMPAAVTAATGMDALTHAIEAYLSVNASDETDRYALLATSMIMSHLEAAYQEGRGEDHGEDHDVETRQALAQAAYFAGLAFTKASLGYVHAIAHNLSALYQTPHGVANAVVLPHLLRFSKPAVLDRLVALAEVSGLLRAGERTAPEVLADRFIDHLEQMLDRFDIPRHLKALKTEDIPRIAKGALKEAHLNYPVPKYMNQKECEALVRLLLVEE